MYKAFYGLTSNPFEISPDPRLYYSTPQHNEALAVLSYGIDRRKGFVVVTGEVGTGKTLLARYVLKTLSWQKIAFAYVFNPLLSTLEFLQYAARDMGVPAIGRNKGELLSALNHFLVGLHKQRLTAAIIIDEAHLLSWELLEEIRLLTNLETANEKLLQILLIGQPELDDKLNSQNLRQLKQRICLRCKLEPLSRDQVREYVERRLWFAGAKERSSKIFCAESIEAIHRYSGGIPRLINSICESALITSYALKHTVVFVSTIDEVAIDLCLVKPAKKVDSMHSDRGAVVLSPLAAAGGSK